MTLRVDDHGTEIQVELASARIHYLQRQCNEDETDSQCWTALLRSIADYIEQHQISITDLNFEMTEDGLLSARLYGFDRRDIVDHD